MLSFWSAMVKRRFSFATKVARNASGSWSSEFSSATIRRRASRGPIVRGEPPQALGLPEVPCKRLTGTTSPRSGFASELAEALYRHAHANRFEKLVIIAPPKILGNLRKAFRAEVVERVAAEIPKELTSHPVGEIERLVAA